MTDKQDDDQVSQTPGPGGFFTEVADQPIQFLLGSGTPAAVFSILGYGHSDGDVVTDVTVQRKKVVKLPKPGVEA